MSAALRHCGIPALTPWQWIRGLAGGGDVRTWPELESHRTIWTYLGRTAIALAARALGLRPGDEVLAPAYNCGTEVDPLPALVPVPDDAPLQDRLIGLFGRRP